MLLLTLSDIAAAGRFNPSLLSGQQRMELFFTPDDHEDAHSQLRGDPDDACTWHYVECDASYNITEITWDRLFITLQGEINMAILPQTIEHLELYFQPLRGALGTSNLPEKIQSLVIDNCLVHGTLDLGSLPPTLFELTVRGNKVTAIENFRNIPFCLCAFYVEESNIVSHQLCVGKLPQNSFFFHFMGCRITDVIFEESADAGRVKI